MLTSFAKRMPLYKIVAMVQVALLARRHVIQRLGPGDARRAAELVRHPHHLSPEEKKELRELAVKLQPRAFLGAAADQLSPVPLPRKLTGVPKKGKRK